MPRDRNTMWAMVHAERAALADDLAGLDDSGWARRSLCGEWIVEEVVAHLTAAASLGRWRWLASMIGARFDADLHNRRRLAEHSGASPAESLENFRAIIPSTTAPSGHTGAWLGEVVVHAQDIRRPLGLTYLPSVSTVTEVARFYASKDFAVNSRTAVRGLRLEATDGPFTAGAGPLVTGTTLALTMAMAGRSAYVADLDGPGVSVLRGRLATEAGNPTP
ncbi:maleylpyruvate isomerase family mycothiol-dependent enzyme [Nocardia shimofusensis]|uniref:maleylpyruvate isomerase family mycothiol-dependent enzyme n=1 Tax=Nocardia shimofusensis TaxID=228596 RepID=UPI000B064B30|nr:maleylpyruvate isomerase family mycothiol-dependent enzyme [Nocardia shimofusensis]